MTSLNNHPILVTKEIVRVFGPTVRFSFSKYRIGPPGFQAQMERSVCTVTGYELTDGWLQNQIETLPVDFELALQSNVLMPGTTWQIPMIDFGTDIEKQIRRFAKTLHSRFFCFESGRSFHGYCAELLLPSDWLNFLGELLLVPHQSETELMDIRWIGHALQRGYSALRWSHQTRRYTSLPRLRFVESGEATARNSRLA